MVDFNPFDNIKVPPVIYKYRDWNNCYHRRVIENRELYFSSPRHFNDPYDCRLPIAYYLLGSDEKYASEYFYSFVKRTFQNWTHDQREKEVKRLLKDGRFKDQKWMEKENADMIEKLHKTFGVISLTANNSNILMWSHYSNSHKGFCVGFHSKILFNNSKDFGSGGMVYYPTEFPVIQPIEDSVVQMIRMLYTKFEKWSYEDEYRLSKLGSADKAIVIPKEAFAEIIIGYLMPKEDQKNLIQNVKSNLPDVKLLKVKPNKHKYELIIEPLNPIH